MMQSGEINLLNIVNEVRTEFERYEIALTTNDVATLDEFFKNAPYTVRLGATENLYGYEEIQEFRKARPSKGLMRTLRNTKITTFGKDMAVVNTEFTKENADVIGRQSQTWVRFNEGWRIVAAHVSSMD